VRPRLVLASGSPRRRQLLSEAGYEFEVVSAPVEELSHDWLSVRELTIWNAARKAGAACKMAPNGVLLAADTLVAIDGEVVGKPADFEDAVEILRRLSGRAHEVWTAVRLVDSARRRLRSFHEMSRVHFRSLDDRAIRNYLEKIDPLDKAGAYAAQGDGQDIIRKIEGSYTNVVGLPMEKTSRALALFGITPSD
jgi:septum formation protein